MLPSRGCVDLHSKSSLPRCAYRPSWDSGRVIALTALFDVTDNSAEGPALKHNAERATKPKSHLSDRFIIRVMRVVCKLTNAERNKGEG